MKINKKIFICFLIVLMLCICINAASASDTTDLNLTSDDAADLPSLEAVEISQDDLSSSGDTFVVDGNGGGDYTTISAAVSAASGGETIFIKNGEYTDSLTFTKSVNIVGESKDGVSIKTGSSSALLETVSGESPILSFENITFKDSARTSSGVISLMGSGDVTFTNCNFVDLSSKYGAIQTNTAGTITISKCTFNNIKEKTNGPGTGLMYLNGAGTVNIYDCVIENCGYEASSSQMNALIYEYSKTGTLNIQRTTITGTTGAASSLIRSSGKVYIKDSVIANNTVSLSSSGYVGDSLFYVTGELDIQTSIISDNAGPKLLLYKNTAADFAMNYCNVQGNSFNGGFTDTAAGEYDVNNNWWGSNDLPTDVTATTWVVEENGEYKLSNGSALDVIIPGVNEEPEEEPVVLPEGTIYVSTTGNDENDGLSEQTAVANITKAVEIAKAKDNKTSTIYILNGEYTTPAVDITEVNITFIGQQKGKVIIHGTGKYIFDVYGDHLISKFENIDFTDSYSPSGNMGALRLYADYSDFTLTNCNFRNISAKYGAIDIQGDYSTANVKNCIVEDVKGSTSTSAIVYINVAETTVNFDNIEIKNCRLDENYASENPATSLRAVFYVASKSATVTLTNSRITDNYGAIYGGVIESKSKLTVENTVISDNIVNTSVNGNNGGEYLIWASDDKADINMANCIITDNTIVKTTKGLFYNQKGSINVEFSDISNNDVEKFIGGTGTITADNNWWGTSDQPDSKVAKWVVMNIELNDTDLTENNKITLTIDFNHVKTTSGLENLTGGEIPKNSYSVDLTAKNGEITPTNVVVSKGETVSKTFTVTEINDEITLTCDGGDVTITIEAIPPYRGIIYVNTTGSDENDGSIDAPVLSIGKAIELANKGSHEIIINEGTYTGYDYQITSNLTVTGAGKVTLDANNEGRLFYMAYGDNADKIALSNLILTNAKGYGAAVYSFAKELILDNVTIVNNQASGYLIKSSGKLTVKDSYISNSTSGNVIDQSGNGDVLIKNTVFENNEITDSTSVYGVVYISSGSGNLVVEDSQFINNTARQGVLIGNNNYNIDVKGSTFIDNTNTVSYGGAIRAQGSTLTVTDSVFINNKASRDGGAVHVGSRTTANIDKSIFINNSVTGYGYHGDAIYNGNKLTVNNCVLLTNANKFIIYNDGEENIVNAQRNWWGTNDNPQSLVASGTYEDDDWEEYPCAEVDVSNWVKMSASFTPSLVLVGDEVTITAVFDNAELPDGIEVTFTSQNGLNTVATTENGKATANYIIGADEKAINATSSDAVIEMPVLFKVQNIVTNDTFFNFFDENGILKDSVEANELLFKGEFSGLTDYVIIDKVVSIVGENAVLNDMGIMILAENVAVDNFTLVATASLGDLINVGASNVDVKNMDIVYIVDDEMANAINIKGTKTISNVNILNNRIYFESHVTSDEDLTTAINMENVEDVIVDGNTIVANIPALYVATYDYDYFLMGLCYVNPIRIYEAESVEITNNKIDVGVNDFEASYPTVQALYIVGSDDILIEGNDFTMEDTVTPEGTAIYLYAVECGFSSGISFIENNFNILTTGGKSGAGSAYALQIVTTDALIIGNNITCDSNGPNLGIYSAYGFGPAKELIITDNFLNISGYAAGTNDFALVSGIEIQTGYATIYNNTIYVQNKGAYNEKYPVAGISAVQYSASTLSFDIQDNEIYTNGKYTVYMLYPSQSATVTGNYLLSYDLQGDKSVYFKSGNNNLVENNSPTNVVTNDTFYDFFDEQGVLKTSIFKELVFNGTFAGLTDIIVLDIPISIVGENAVLNDIAIKITADNVKLDGLKLNSDKEFAINEGALIYAEGSNIKVNDIIVNYTAPSDVEAIGIYANAADNFALTNSEIIYLSSNPGSKHHYGLEVRNSDNVSIENNNIDATLPAVNVAYGTGEGIDIDLVLAVGIQGGKNINFTHNTVNVNTNGGIGDYPTIDTIQIHSADNVLVNLNTITHIDLTTSDSARYYNCVDIYSSTATIENNNILVNTTSGIKRTGTAYPIQLTGPFTVTVSNNTLTSISNGPNAGIYAANWNGYGDLTAVGNVIDITGSVVADDYALVAGIEAEIDVARVYDNIITVANLADYDDTNPVYGVSLAASYYNGDPTADIRGNNITVDGKYAVYYKYAHDANVTLNELLAHELEGDAAALIESGENNYIEINFPPYLPEIIIEAETVWIGSDDTIVVTVVGATGNVTIKVNEKEFKDLQLVNGTVSQIVSAADLIGGINEVTVTFTSTTEGIRSGSENYTFYVLDGVVTQDNYMLYFNQDDNGKFFDYVPEGATLDFQGSIINPDQAITVQMNVNKPVNIISSTGDAYIDLNTTAGSLLGESPGNSFAVTNGGSGSNVTGIYFHNTQLWISNTHNVVLDGISVVVEDQRVGSGVGATTIRDNSSYVILKNSYLYTRNNGGSTTFTMSWAEHCTIDNCTVKAEGNVGNLIYLNTFNIVGAPTGVPLNNYNTVSNNKIYGKEGSGISVGLMVEGTHNLIINNTLYKSSISTSFGAQKPADNIYTGNVMTEGGSLTAQANSIVYGNDVSGSLTAGSNSVVYNNTVGKAMTVTAGATAYNNTVGTSMSVAAGSTAYNNNVGTTMSVAKDAIVHDNIVGTTMTVSGAAAKVYGNTMGALNINAANCIVENNTVNGAVTIAKAATGTNFIGNNVTGTVTVNSNNNIIKENEIISTDTYAVDLKTSTGNQVTDNYLLANEFFGNDAVSGEGTIENNLPIAADIVVSVENITIGETAEINIKIADLATGSVQVVLDGKRYNLPIENGAASINVTDLKASQYTVAAIYDGCHDVMPSRNSTTFTVSKLKSDVVITTSDLNIGEDVNVTVSIEGATGSVNLVVDGSSNTLDLTDGVATYTIKAVTAGTHSLTAIYMGDASHDFATNTTKFTIDKIATSINLSDMTVAYGTPIPISFVIGEDATGKVYIITNGEKSIETLKDGAVNFTLEGLARGVYTMSLSYEGDVKYLACDKTIEITVNGTNAGLKANASDIKVGENATINVEINSKATGAVVIILDEEYAVDIVDGKGSIVLSGLANGTYTATVKYDGDKEFYADEITVNFTVSKEEIPSDINISMDIPEGTIAPEFTINLPSDATGNFSVTIDNQTYTEQLINGSATVKVPELAAGNHTISTLYSGDDKYEGFASNESTVDFPKASIPGGEDALNLTSPEGSDSPTYSINLPGATGNLTVNVDGKDTYTQALVNGTASITVPGLSEGNHNITVTYSGDDKFSSISKNTTYHAPVYRIAENKDVSALYSATASYKVLITKDGKAVGAGESVIITFNGKKTTVKTDSKGYATLKLNTKVKVKTYPITAEYKDQKVTNKVAVKHVIKAANKKVKKSKKVTKIKVTLKKVNGKVLKSKKLKIKFNKKTYKVKTNKKGVATWKVKKSMVKKLKVGKKYKYTVTYGKDKVTKKLTIKK